MRARIARSGMDFWAVLAAAAIATLLLIAATQMQAQTYTVIHQFTNGGDGAAPMSGLTIDRAGNFYGTTTQSSTTHGTVFKLTRHGTGWILSMLHSFTFIEGTTPMARVIIGPDGSLYGTTARGGAGGSCGGDGCGTIYRLQPPATVCSSVQCPWTLTVLYRFTGGSDGGVPASEVVFDQSGNLYGTAQYGGVAGCSGSCGVVYKLAHPNGAWVQSVIYSFTGHSDGDTPISGLTFDSSGNLYGTTHTGGDVGEGTIFKLSPSGSGWNFQTLYAFQGQADGNSPAGGVIIDAQGNLYGTSWQGGDFQYCFAGCGAVVSLSPSNGDWMPAVLHTFTGQPNGDGFPQANLVMDASGSLIGTSYGRNWGNIFKLTSSGGGWTYTTLYNFMDGTDGADPASNVVIDANGNLFGTASKGGSEGAGVIWQVTP